MFRLRYQTQLILKAVWEKCCPNRFSIHHKKNFFHLLMSYKSNPTGNGFIEDAFQALDKQSIR